MLFAVSPLILIRLELYNNESVRIIPPVVVNELLGRGVQVSPQSVSLRLLVGKQQTGASCRTASF